MELWDLPHFWTIFQAFLWASRPALEPLLVELFAHDMALGPKVARWKSNMKRDEQGGSLDQIWPNRTSAEYSEYLFSNDFVGENTVIYFAQLLLSQQLWRVRQCQNRTTPWLLQILQVLSNHLGFGIASKFMKCNIKQQSPKCGMLDARLQAQRKEIVASSVHFWSKRPQSAQIDSPIHLKTLGQPWAH